jgi:hypothetical protein
VIAGILLILTFCCCGAIRLGISVMKASAKFVADNLRIFFLPFIAFIFLSIWIGGWFLGGLWLWTVGYAKPRPGFEFSTEIMWDKSVKPCLVYYVFGFFWVVAFIIGSNQFVMAASAVIWYFD